MTRTSVMSVTVSPWIPTATREAVRDTTPVHDTVTSPVFVYVCVMQRGLILSTEAGLVYLRALECECD